MTSETALFCCRFLYLNFVSDLLMYHVFEFSFNLLLIFCSRAHRTALHLAARYGRTSVCQLLIAGKADVNATDRCAFVFEICC
jgi:hypothetical protein